MSLPVRRRRVRLQGQHLAARDAGRDGGKVVGRPVKLVLTRGKCSPRTATGRDDQRSKLAADPRANVAMLTDGSSQMRNPRGEFTEPVGSPPRCCTPAPMSG